MVKKIAVILAGGKGERLWPLSRSDKPKQLLPLVSDKSLIEETILRIKNFDVDEIFILTTQELKDKFENISKEYGVKIFAEPRGKNTLPAIAYMAGIIKRLYDDAIMILLPADHVIKDLNSFSKFMEEGVSSAEKNNLVTFGIVPTRPDTNYGYIEMGKNVSGNIYKVNSFREKPGYKDAADYIKSGNFLWNAGIFVWKISVIIDEIKQHQPDLFALLQDLIESDSTNLDKYTSVLYDKAIATSIDYGIMEYSQNVTVIKSTFDWDDVGSWLSLRRHYKEDEEGNVAKGNIIIKDGSYNTVYSDKNGLLVVSGISDAVIIRTSDVTLICKQDNIDNIKDLLKEIKEKEELKKFL